MHITDVAFFDNIDKSLQEHTHKRKDSESSADTADTQV